MRARAVAWLRRAAELAVGRYELQDCLALLQRALELEESAARMVELWCEIARANALSWEAEGFWSAMHRAIELADAADVKGDLYAELAFQTLVRSGMWRTVPDRELVDGWIDRALELTPPDTASRTKALIARCYHEQEKSPALAQEASDLATALGDTALRSHAYDVLGLTAFASADYVGALAWQRRRVALADGIDDPDHRADVYVSAISPAVACGEFADARRYAAAQLEITQALSPHHRLHGILGVALVDELAGDWTRIRELQPEIERVVEENASTPCIGNERLLLVCALASAFRGDEAEVERLESRAKRHHMEGYGMVTGGPRSSLPSYAAIWNRWRPCSTTSGFGERRGSTLVRSRRGSTRWGPCGITTASSPRRRGSLPEACTSSPSPCARSGSCARTGTSWNGPPSALRRSASTGTRREPESCSRPSRSRSPG